MLAPVRAANLADLVDMLQRVARDYIHEVAEAPLPAIDDDVAVPGVEPALLDLHDRWSERLWESLDLSPAPLDVRLFGLAA